MPSRTTRFLVTLLTLASLGACEKTATEPDPETEEALFGLWRHTAVGEFERTVEFFPDGTLFVVEVDWDLPSCGSAAGTWSVDTLGTINVSYTERDGASVSEPIVGIEYFIDSSRLVFTSPVRFRPETHGRLDGSMPTCADYGWMSMVMSADVDGTATDFSWTGFYDFDLESSIGSGFLPIIGYDDPSGPGVGPCGTCDVLNIDLFHELGVALTTGGYPVETFGPTGLRAEVEYLLPASSANYGSNDSDPNTQPWSGQAAVTTVTTEVVEGTFEFVLYDATGTGPPYPSVTITNGSFRLSFD